MRVALIILLLFLFASCAQERQFSPPAWIRGSWTDGKRDQIRFSADAITEGADSSADYYAGISLPLTEQVYGDTLYYVFTNDDTYLDKFIKLDGTKILRLTVRHRHEMNAKAVQTVFRRINLRR